MAYIAPFALVVFHPGRHDTPGIGRRQTDLANKIKEWRCIASEANCFCRQGGAEAAQLLREIYGWFTEGFDMADLQEAKALLAELSGS